MTLGPQFQFDLPGDMRPVSRPSTYTDVAGRSRIATTEVLPEWWKDAYENDVDPELNTPQDIMDATRHIRGVDNDFVEVDQSWLPDDRRDLVWHGSGSRINDDYVSAASSIGATYRYDGLDEGLREYRGGWHDADKVWASTPRIARDYAGGPSDKGYMYGLDVTGDIEYTGDGYAFDEDENKIKERYKYNNG